MKGPRLWDVGVDFLWEGGTETPDSKTIKLIQEIGSNFGFPVLTLDHAPALIMRGDGEALVFFVEPGKFPLENITVKYVVSDKNKRSTDYVLLDENFETLDELLKHLDYWIIICRRIFEASPFVPKGVVH